MTIQLFLNSLVICQIWFGLSCIICYWNVRYIIIRPLFFLHVNSFCKWILSLFCYKEIDCMCTFHSSVISSTSKLVLDKFDNDFENSCLKFLANLSEAQFFAQLISDYMNWEDELFVVEHKMQPPTLWSTNYVMVMGLKCHPMPVGNNFNKVINKTRLKDEYFKASDQDSCVELEKAFLHPLTTRANR